jgi:hypothetical protein
LIPYNKVPKEYTQSDMMRQLRRAKISMKDLKNDETRKPHKKTKQPIDKEKAWFLASTCQTAYPIVEFFTEPSHKGVYVFEGTKADTRSVCHLDAYRWHNDSRYETTTLAEKAVIVTHYTSFGSEKDRNIDFKKHSFFFEELNRWVIQYSGNPERAHYIKELGMGESPSDSETDDVIGESEKETPRSKKTISAKKRTVNKTKIQKQ